MVPSKHLLNYPYTLKLQKTESRSFFRVLGLAYQSSTSLLWQFSLLQSLMICRRYSKLSESKINVLKPPIPCKKFEISLTLFIRLIIRRNKIYMVVNSLDGSRKNQTCIFSTISWIYLIRDNLCGSKRRLLLLVYIEQIQHHLSPETSIWLLNFHKSGVWRH